MARKTISAGDIRLLLDKTGLKQTQFAERIGVSQPTVSRWLKGAKPEPELQDTMLLMMEEMELFLHPSKADRNTVPLVGFVGAGWTVSIVNEQGGEIDRVPAPLGAGPDTVAVEIRGESLGRFFDRWLVYYDEVRNPVTDDILDKLCVVGIVGDGVYIKKLTKGGLPGRYHLLSQYDSPMYDVEVEWAAPVVSMGPK